jgi:hypothetical protein
MTKSFHRCIKCIAKGLIGNRTNTDILTNDLANIAETMMAIDFINRDIKRIRIYINFDADDVFETDSKAAFENKLGRLLTIRHALQNKLKRLESS